MIIGIGTDLVSIPRMEATWQRRGEAFARRILSPQEWALFRPCAQGPAPASEPLAVPGGTAARWLAKRFAAKEALSKALGTGMRGVVRFNGISVLHDALGAPRLSVDTALAALLAQRGIDRLHLSLTDEREAALAFVVLESLPAGACPP